MDKRANRSPYSALDGEFTAALEWWREAGVDCAFQDDPRSWVAADPAVKAEAPLPPVSAEPLPRSVPARDQAVPDPASWPGELGRFAPWWLGEPWLDGGRQGGRVPPRGPMGAKLMVIVPQPEREDVDKLLSGPQGRLVDAILSAMGIGAEQAYFASVLPRHTPMADWAEIARAGLGDVLSHHVSLAGPQRLLVFGGNIPPLVGNDPAQKPAVSQHFNHENCRVPMLAAMDLEALSERPRWKADLWHVWLEWTTEA